MFQGGTLEHMEQDKIVNSLKSITNTRAGGLNLPVLFNLDRSR